MDHVRRNILPVLAPTVVFSIGEGAVIPMIPAVSAAIGADIATAGLVAAMIPVGHVLGDLPSGWLVARLGERTSMIGAALVSLIGIGIALSASNPALLCIGILIIGISAAVFSLARHALLTTSIPYAFRARALVLLGGSYRLGLFIGPFIAIFMIQFAASTHAVFWVHFISCLLAVVILVLFPSRGLKPMAGRRTQHRRAGALVRSRMPDREPVSALSANDGIFLTIWQSRQVLASLGTGIALVSAIRASRTIIVPLWAVSIGVPDTSTAVVIGIAGAIDFGLFYTSGQIMDRWGRIWTAVPTTLGLGLAHLILAFTHEVDNRFFWFVACAMFMALANGIGAGILLTLGADLADPSNPAPFLGAWRFTYDAGGALAPLAVAGITAGSSLAVSSGMVGVLGLVGAAIFGRYIPRFATQRGAVSE